MNPLFRSLRRKLRLLLRLSETADSPVLFSKYIPDRAPGVDLELFYQTASANEPLPVPPRDLWLGYGSDEASYTRSGLDDINRMSEILARSGTILADLRQPVLDLGCGGGRMIRHLRDLAARTEVWGLDISAAHIGWLKSRLAPPFHFAVNTTLPHLSFADGYFGLIYCGSVFTHIDDLAESWFLEVRRVLAPGGILYCTLHDEHTRERLHAEPHHPLARSLCGHGIMEPGRAIGDIVVTGQGADSNVYYHSRYLRPMLTPFFEILDVVPGAYGYQTAWVLRKRTSA